MRLQYKHQKFQYDAAKAVCGVFEGQPYLTSNYMIDRGIEGQYSLDDDRNFTGFKNHKLIPELTDDIILGNLNKIQRMNYIEPSRTLEGKYNLTIEMETGVGKTYTYIKTMYELNKAYGWSKFIVVVPSVAIREGVYKSFQMTQDHFMEEYGKKIRYFIYNSSQLTDIDQFASDSSINVMIINSQAFNAKGKDARRIYMKLDEFRSRRPIDIIAKTNPILIIDEPQSVEGKQTKERLKEFEPLFTLRYSATHKRDSIYNMVYRLDAMEAYNKKLVKRIAVKGISVTGNDATNGYLYLEGLNLSQEKSPVAKLEFDVKGKNGVKKVTKLVKEGYNLFDYSGELTEYQNNYVITSIDGRDNSVSFMNGITLFAGDVVGDVNEEQLRRIQIRETILSHLERERQLFYKGIKVLSLFFIDEVANYRIYDKNGVAQNGIYADIFEEEYTNILHSLQTELGANAYMDYLNGISAEQTHQGYFSIDKKKHLVNSKTDRGTTESSDQEAYDLIMKDKERLLDRAEPVRFIFSHSALREGWDNPNVFQICTLKQSSSDVRKRQEVGRGLRLCVNQSGERMDANILGEEVHNVNVLTVIASESYDSFARGLQSEIAEAVADRPRLVTIDLFKNKVIHTADNEEQMVDQTMAEDILEELITKGYSKRGVLTEKFYSDKKNMRVEFSEELTPYTDDILKILDTIYDSHSGMPDNARDNNVELKYDEDKLNRSEFQKLWKRINRKSVYVVDFDTEELVKNAIEALNKSLRVSEVFVHVEQGTMTEIESKEKLQMGVSFTRESDSYVSKIALHANSRVKYDLIGKIVNETGLTRKTVVDILKGINQPVFDQFKKNPEEFIIKASNLINEQKATAIIQHITYNKLDETYGTNIFTEPTLKGKLGVNAVKTKRNLYDYVLYDSENEKKFAENLDACEEVAVYVKLPSGFYINTPVGHYNPDWAISFYEGKVKHIYFVAETKGSMQSMQLREIEKVKIKCAEEHFKAISSDSVKYDVIKDYNGLMQAVMK